MWSLSLITPPQAAAIDREKEIVPYLKLASSEAAAQAAIIDILIDQATVACETFTMRQLITATWELWLSQWAECELYREGALHIPRPPLQPQGVNAGVLSVKYLDTNGVEQTLGTDQYQILAAVGPQAQRGLIFAAYQAIWPSIRCQPGTIKIRFTAGYGATYEAVPKAIRAGLLKRVLNLYDGRDETGVAPLGVTAEGCWWPFRAW